MSHLIKVAGVIASTALALSLTSGPAFADRAADDAKRHYDKAQKAIKKKNWHAAASSLSRAVKLVGNAEYIGALCMVQDQLYGVDNWQDWVPPEDSVMSGDGPIETCKLAVKLNSGKARKQAKKHLASLEADAATARAKNYADDARYEADNGDDADAVKLYKKAIAIDPQAKYMFGLCKAYHRTGDTAKARTTCNKAAKKTKSKKLKKKIKAELAKISGTDSASPSADTKKLEDDVYEAVRVLDYVYLDRTYEDHTLVAHIGTARVCVDGVKGLLASGMKKSDEMAISHNDVPNTTWRTDVDPNGWVTTLGDIQTYCVGLHDGLRMGNIVTRLTESKEALAKIAAEKESSNDPTAMMYYSMELKKCDEAVAGAIEKGIDKKTKITLGDGTTVTLGTAKAKVCDVMADAIDDAGQTIAARIKAARHAKLAPYRKVMKGDKYRLIDEERFSEFRVYGKGGVALDSPKSLAKAKLWFVVTTNQYETKWTMTRYQFSGNTLKKQTTKHGPNAWPKTKEFR